MVAKSGGFGGTHFPTRNSVDILARDAAKKVEAGAPNACNRYVSEF